VLLIWWESRIRLVCCVRHTISLVRNDVLLDHADISPFSHSHADFAFGATRMNWYVLVAQQSVCSHSDHENSTCGRWLLKYSIFVNSMVHLIDI